MSETSHGSLNLTFFRFSNIYNISTSWSFKLVFFKRSAWHQTKFLLEAFLNFFLVREILTFYCFSIFFFVLLCIFFKVKIRNRQNPLTKSLPVHLGLLINFNYIKKMNRVGVIKVYVEWDDIFFCHFFCHFRCHFR